MRKFLLKIRGNPFDRLVAKAIKKGQRRFLLVWNRGLGDIPLGLYALVCRLRKLHPESSLSVVTRSDLKEGFALLPDVEVIEAPHWRRKQPVDLQGALAEAKREQKEWDVTLERVDPTRWFAWQIGKLTPRLTLPINVWGVEKFSHLPKQGVAMHIQSETGQFYGYAKDWPIDLWRKVVEDLFPRPVFLLGLNPHPHFPYPHVMDMRGQTSILQMLYLIKNHCDTLIAPDGGVLSLTYYLDEPFALKIVSLWADPRQGILKQNVASPNPFLQHVPLIAPFGDLSQLPLGQVQSVLSN